MDAAPASFWNLIDAVCIINLDHRTDRWETIGSRLKTIVPEQKIHRISAVWGKKLPGYREHRLFHGITEEEALFWAGRAGCVLSHRKVLELVGQNGWNNTLILEDDAELLDNLDGTIGDLLSRTILNAPRWDLFYLGCTPYSDRAVLIDREKTSQDTVNIARIVGPLCTHAYLVNDRSAEDYVNRLPDENGIWAWLAWHNSLDSWIANEYGNRTAATILGCYPNLVIQGQSYSDIEHIDITHNQGGLGGTPHPVQYIGEEQFARMLHAPKYLLKRQLKIAAHYALGAYYHMAGYRKFSVSIENAGYWGAIKAAWQVLRQRGK